MLIKRIQAALTGIAQRKLAETHQVVTNIPSLSQNFPPSIKIDGEVHTYIIQKKGIKQAFDKRQRKIHKLSFPI